MKIKQYKYSKEQSYKINKLLQYVRPPMILYDYDIIVCYSSEGNKIGYAVIEHGDRSLHGDCPEYIAHINYNLSLLEIYSSEQLKGYGTFIMNNIKKIYKLNEKNRIIIKCDVDVMQFYSKNNAYEIPNTYFDDELLMII
uniref:Acetyltransferase (GNAT) family protein n=1 Tax=Pithovirus LCPAC101 TaxID=2506586 RepID=A0A481Z3D6_9VIRU|nr:MAG: hypothetical protein LCPAC101_01640 [Pithovirus LCPAC101]